MMLYHLINLQFLKIQLNQIQQMSTGNQDQPARIELERLRNQQIQFKVTIANLEAEAKIFKAKSNVVQNQLQRMVKQNRNLISLLQKQKNQKNMLLIKDKQASYNQTKGSVQARRYEALAKSLTQQNQVLKVELQKAQAQKVKYVKEKQQISNKLIIAQSKMQASSVQQSVIQALQRSVQFANKENQQLKKQAESLRGRLKQGGVSYEKTILKDSNQTREELTKQFQEKMNSKQLANAQLRERYQKKISQLNLKIIELQSIIKH